MKRFFIFLAITFLFFMHLAYAQTPERISLSFKQNSVENILKALSQYRSFNLISEVDLTQKISVQIKDLTWQESLITICNIAKIECDLDKNNLHISAKSNPLQQNNLPKINYKNYPTEIIEVNHLSADAITQLIQNTAHLSQQGQVIFLKEKGIVVVNDANERKKAIHALIEQLDLVPAQIHISAHIVTMSDESINELGINWNYKSDSSGLSNLNFNLGVSSSSANIGFNIATRSGNFLQLELSALEAENQVEIVASPNLMTSNKETASIKQGTEIPYEVASGTNGNTTIEFKQAVLGLEVTPRILKNGLIELTLIVTQNTAGKTIKKSDGGESLAIDTQEIKSKVIVRQSETVVLGGIFQQQITNQTKEVPGLGKMPLIGGLFRYDGKTIQKRELVVFITPKLYRHAESI